MSITGHWEEQFRSTRSTSRRSCFTAAMSVVSSRWSTTATKVRLLLKRGYKSRWEDFSSGDKIQIKVFT